MPENRTNKYKIKNLDCAVCANRIELELNKQDDVKQASVDPVNAILETNLNDLARLNRIVKNIEPAAEVEEIKSTKAPDEQTRLTGK
jgi:Zn2+/Cd2+-exporting ATPase